MKSVIILSCVSLMAVFISGCKSVSDEEALKSYVINRDFRGARNVMKRMIASGADVNTTRTIEGIAPLHVAVVTDDIEFAKFLILKGADVNIKADNGFTPLNFAAASGYDYSTKMIKLLLKNGANPNSCNNLQSPLIGASRNGYYEIVKLLVENGADVNLADGGKATALLCANDVKITKYLIDKGANVKAKNIDGRTVLMHVVCCREMNTTEKNELISLLIEKGVEINVVQQSFIELKYGLHPTPYTALDWAITNEQPEEIISLLRSKGAKTAAELKAEKPAPASDDKK